MRWYELYIFLILCGFVGYCFGSVTGFFVGLGWGIVVSLILTIFGKQPI